MWNEGCGLMDGTISKDELCIHPLKKYSNKVKDETNNVRAKTLKLVEDLEAENTVLKLQLNEILSITRDKLNNIGFDVVKLDNEHYTLVECKTKHLGGKN